MKKKNKKSCIVCAVSHWNGWLSFLLFLWAIEQYAADFGIGFGCNATTGTAPTRNTKYENK